jgi:hypothetical protein
VTRAVVALYTREKCLMQAWNRNLIPRPFGPQKCGYTFSAIRTHDLRLDAQNLTWPQWTNEIGSIAKKCFMLVRTTRKRQTYMKVESTCPFMKTRDLKMDTGRTNKCGKWRKNSPGKIKSREKRWKEEGVKFLKRIVQFKQANLCTQIINLIISWSKI